MNSALDRSFEDPQTLGGRLSAYLTEQLGRPTTVSALKRFPSGFSWVTFAFEIDPPAPSGADRAFVIRLGPAYGLFAPYSAAPQFFALKAVEGAPVPAPRVYYWSDDPALLGAPFFISERSVGDTPIPWGEDAMSDELRNKLGPQFADALGALHAVDWSKTGLSAQGAGHTLENTAHKQLDTMEADCRRWALRHHPMARKAFAWLRANAPVAPRLSIIHGDYRLGNFLELNGKITAILDWELTHIGDPHEDLGWACLPQYRGGTDLVSRLIPLDALIERHGAVSGLTIDAGSLRYYTIFSLLKLAVTHMAAVCAFERNGFSDMRMPAMGTQIAPVLRQIEKALAA